MMSEPLAPLWLMLVLALMGASGVIAWARTRTRNARVAANLYGSIVTQARAREFFAIFGIKDTLEGRFEVLALHLVLVLDRLRREGEAGAWIGRALLEQFVIDMDDSIRELGISDLAVPRRMRKIAAAVAERDGDYRAALADRGSDSRIEDAIIRHLALEEGPIDAQALAAYVRRTARELGGQPASDLLAGRVTFPEVLSEQEDLGP